MNEWILTEQDIFHELDLNQEAYLFSVPRRHQAFQTYSKWMCKPLPSHKTTHQLHTITYISEMLITFHIFHIHKSPCLPRGLISGVESLMWDWGGVWGDNAPNQEAQGVRPYGQLPLSRVTIRVTSGYEMKSELLIRRLVWSSPKALHLTWYVTEKSCKAVITASCKFSPVQELQFVVGLRPHESLFPPSGGRDAHKYDLKLILWGYLSEDLPFHIWSEEVKAEIYFR